MSTESFSGGSDPDTEDRTLPPYEGRRETADVGDQSNSEKAGAPDPADTARGRQASPAVEQPADQMSESETSDPGVGPAHFSGTQRGEDPS
jgi:hypothetical protein